MKLTTEQIKQLIKEELQNLQLEGLKGFPFEGGGIIIYFEDEDSDDPKVDIIKGSEKISQMKDERGVDQSVPMSSSDPDFIKITKELTKRGYDFKVIAGDFKVKVPGGNSYVDYVLRYGRKQKK